ncbi:uncharacterized protein [Diabrotica undecimpunctata]|uniref:uncharacterized protein isoform X1 n=1 Tax=Diabrotica undecimpunctata TaxID=50387 RepID=UPI003B6364E7
MTESNKKSRTKKGGKTLTTKLPDDIKEKSYLTRHVDTSIAILDSPENDIVLESLLFLSKYADLCLINLNYLQQRGLLQKILKLLDRNICILRLCLRLLNILLSIEDVMIEFDQEEYDSDIQRITNFYIYHKDLHVKEFAVSILSKVASSCRITSLIFSLDLLHPILSALKSVKNVNLLQMSMILLDGLLTAPAALCILPEVKNFDISTIVKLLQHPEGEVNAQAFKIISKLTFFCLNVYQVMFKKEKIVEKMMNVVMDPLQRDNHEISMKIILDCMNSDVTSTYFIESLEFLKFCAWVKTCESDYLPKCADIFLKLSSIPSIRQTLFDLSVEESILYFLRSKEKYVLNRACAAISNMSEHPYCCDHMLTGKVVQTIFNILERTDDEIDPQNEVAIKTLCNLTKRSLKTLQFLFKLEAQQKFFELFTKGLATLSPEAYLNITEIIYHFVVYPEYQKSIVNSKLFTELLKASQSECEKVAVLSLEIITFCMVKPIFLELFTNLNGPTIIVQQLKSTTNPKLRNCLLILIHSAISNDSITLEFLKNGLVNVLREFSEEIRESAPIIETILNLSYNIYLPLKFFETHRLEITDKLNNQFYLINGYWTDEFPFLDIIRCENLSTISSIYVVDYTYDAAEPTCSISNMSFNTMDSDESKNYAISPNERSLTTSKLLRNSEHFSKVTPDYEINYGDLSPDPFLPKYINNINKLFEDETSIINKIRILSKFVDTILCGPNESLKIPQKFHTFKLHIQSLKFKFGTNMIPIGYLRIGFYCERALLFKAIADRTCIPCSLVRGKNQVYWNEVALLQQEDDDMNSSKIVFYIVDLMHDIGSLMAVGTREADFYCNSNDFKYM